MNKCMLRLLSVLTIVAATALPSRGQCLEWSDKFYSRGLHKTNGAGDAIVYAYAAFDDGTGPALYATGDFTVAGNVAANNIVKWDGANWQPLGSGLDDFGLALGVFDDGTGPALYVGGAFTSAGGVSANRIAKWNGTSWSALGTGLQGAGSASASELTVFDDGTGPALYVGGAFTIAGGSTANRIAKWNGSTWSDVGGGTDGQVRSLAVFNDGFAPALYASGVFTTAGGTPCNNIARWDGSSWTDLANGLNGPADLAVFDSGSGDELYAAGVFNFAGEVPANSIAKWNATTGWSPLGSGLNSPAQSVSVFDDGSGEALYVGGSFTIAGGTFASRIARWNGTSFSALGTGCDLTVTALFPFDFGSGPTLFAGGQFSTAGFEYVEHVAQWDGTAWDRIDSGGMAVIGSFVRAVTVFDDGSGLALYAGGEFLDAGDVHANHVAKWDGAAWSPLGDGVAGPAGSGLRALLVFDDGSGPALFAGGKFTTAGGAPANSVAKWDGANWSPLGAGITGGSPPIVNALAVFDDGTGAALYASGTFTTADGNSANNIAKWNGTSWSALGTGITGGSGTAVNALAVFDDGSGEALFAVGQFSTAGGAPANRIAKWDGWTWTAAGGFNNTVHALTVFDDGTGAALYAGGIFSMASGVPVTRIAKLSGGSWGPLGAGVSDAVFTLQAFDDGSGAALYAGGAFTMAGAASANHIAKWKSSTWSSLANGTDNWVYALGAFEDGADGAPDLYVGGGFTQADGKPSIDFAQWHGCPLGNAYCFGDGLDPVVTAQCPCANFGDPGRGCANSNGALGGGHLRASGTTSPNTVLLTCDGIPNGALATFMRGPNHDPMGAVFGDGIKCLTSPLFRFGSQNAGTIGNPPSTVEVGAPNEVPGSTVHYFVQYRNSVPGFCAPETFNASNGFTISW